LEELPTGFLSHVSTCSWNCNYLDGSRIGCLHQHHGHRWPEEDDVGVFVGCQIFVLEISSRRVASAPYLPDKAKGTRFQDDVLLPKRDYLVSSVKIGRRRGSRRTLSVSQSYLRVSTSSFVTGSCLADLVWNMADAADRHAQQTS
jgi:hypothetical protein